MNSRKMSLEVNRGEACDLLLACTLVAFSSERAGKKWMTLHDKLLRQLEESDNENKEDIK